MWMIGAGVLAIFSASAFIFQWHTNAASHEFMSDEALHLITSVALRDLVLSGHLFAPIQFLTRFYEHYQFLGIGLWPPGYHLLGAAWLMAFGPSTVAAMALQAFLGAALATTATLAAWRTCGGLSAIACGAAVFAAPLTLAALTGLVADLPTSLFMAWATLSYVRLLRRQRVVDGLLFGATALAAIMMKGNAIALGLLPPLAIVLSRRWGAVRTWAFWVPAVIVLPVAVPWYLLTYSWTSAGFRYHVGTEFAANSSAFVWRVLTTDLGPVLLVLAAVAAVDVVRRSCPDPLDPVLLASLAGTILFQVAIPVALEPRYLLPCVVPIVLLAARGARIAATIIRQPARISIGAPALLCIGIAGMVLTAPSPVASTPIGARAVAAYLLEVLPPLDKVVLIASDSLGEGAISGELSMSDGIVPAIVAARGSKLLGGGGYNNFQYEPRFVSADEALRLVDTLEIPVVVVDRSVAAGAWKHNEQLGAALEQGPSNYVLDKRITSDGRSFDVYLRRGTPPQPSRGDALAALLRPRKALPGAR